jgi:hypothetical protein
VIHSLKDYPHLIVNQCPLGCGNCAGVYLNQQSGHRIVCQCIKCHHKQDLKQKTGADLGRASLTVVKKKKKKEGKNIGGDGSCRQDLLVIQ